MNSQFFKGPSSTGSNYSFAQTHQSAEDVAVRGLPLILKRDGGGPHWEVQWNAAPWLMRSAAELAESKADTARVDAVVQQAMDKVWKAPESDAVAALIRRVVEQDELLHFI